MLHYRCIVKSHLSYWCHLSHWAVPTCSSPQTKSACFSFRFVFLYLSLAPSPEYVNITRGKKTKLLFFSPLKLLHLLAHLDRCEGNMITMSSMLVCAMGCGCFQWPLRPGGTPLLLHSPLQFVNSFKRSLSAVACQVARIISNSSLTTVQCIYIPSNSFPFCSVLLIPKSASRICLGSLPKERCWLPRGSPHIWASSPLTLTHACSHMSDESKSLEKSGQILLRLLYSAALVEVRITDLFKKHLQLNLNLISSGSKVNGVLFPHRAVGFLPLILSKHEIGCQVNCFLTHPPALPQHHIPCSPQAPGQERVEFVCGSLWGHLEPLRKSKPTAVPPNLQHRPFKGSI